MRVDNQMGDFWGDILSVTSDAYKEKQAASIAQSQASIAQSQALAAQANAAAVAAAQRRQLFSTPVMLAAAAGLFGLLIYMRKRRA